MRIQDFGLKEAVEKGQIPILTDAKLNGAASLVNPRGMNSICDWHSVGRVEVRAREFHLPKFDPDANEKWKVCIESFAQYLNFY